MIRSFVVGTFLLASVGSAYSQQESGYPNAKLLVEPKPLLNEARGGSAPVILDARSRDKYDEGHLPGAVWVDHETWSKKFLEMDGPKAWSERIASLGIDKQSSVVVYDDNRTKDAARIWWILRYWGVNNVRLLHGGWVGWQAADMPVEKTPNQPSPSEFRAEPVNDKLATKNDILKSLNGNKLQIVDARTEDEFCGIDGKDNQKAGAIPGAKNLEWVDLLDKDTHRFKSPNELNKLFEEAGIRLNRPSATHCQSGGRAAVMAFGMELMGAKQVRNYYQSWSEWGNSEDTPIEKPKPAK